MAKLSEKVKKMISELHPALVATTSKDGKPNVSPKGSLRVVDDEHVVFVEGGQLHTLANLRENPQISAIIYDPATSQGCRIWGKAEILKSGDLFDTLSTEFVAKGVKLNQVVKVMVEEAITF